jgi:zinc finger protein 706
MARGQQKIQSQQKKAKKQLEIKKQQGHDQKAAAQKALLFTCVTCKVCSNYHSIKRLYHFIYSLLSFSTFFFYPFS